MAAEDGIKAPPAIQDKLRKLGLTRRDDLVLHLPLRYEDETSITLIGEAMPGVPVQVDAEVLDVSVQFRPRRQLVATVADASGELTLRFLNFYGSQLNRISDAISVKRGELLRIKKLLQSRLGTSDTAARYHYEDMILRINTALGIK